MVLYPVFYKYKNVQSYKQKAVCNTMREITIPFPLMIMIFLLLGHQSSKYLVIFFVVLKQHFLCLYICGDINLCSLLIWHLNT